MYHAKLIPSRPEYTNTPDLIEIQLWELKDEILRSATKTIAISAIRTMITNLIETYEELKMKLRTPLPADQSSSSMLGDNSIYNKFFYSQPSHRAIEYLSSLSYMTPAYLKTVRVNTSYGEFTDGEMIDWLVTQTILSLLRDQRINPPYPAFKMESLALIIVVKLSGASMPVFYGDYLLTPSSPRDNNVGMTALSDCKLPDDIIGNVFSKMVSSKLVSMMNICTKTGVSKPPLYYNYINVLPYIVFKLAIQGLKDAVLERDKNMYLFIMRRALQLDHELSKQLILNGNNIPIEIADEILVNIQFDESFNFIIGQMDKRCYKGVLMSLFQRGLIDKKKYDSITIESTTPVDIPDDVSIYNFNFSIQVIISAIKLGTLENMLCKFDDECGETEDLIHAVSDIKDLSDGDKSLLNPYVKDNSVFNHLTGGDPIPDLVTEFNEIECLLILQAGIDPSSFPNKFQSLPETENDPPGDPEGKYYVPDVDLRVTNLNRFQRIKYSIQANENIYYTIESAHYSDFVLFTWFRSGDRFYGNSIIEKPSDSIYYELLLYERIPEVNHYIDLDVIMHAHIDHTDPLLLQKLEVYKNKLVEMVANQHWRSVPGYLRAMVPTR